MEERRMFERFKVAFPVKFTNLKTNKEGNGKIIDISAGGGGMIITKHQIEPETALKLELQIPDTKNTVVASGKVVWIHEISTDTYRMGVQFDKIDFLSLSRVLKYTESKEKKSE